MAEKEWKTKNRGKEQGNKQKIGTNIVDINLSI